MSNAGTVVFLGDLCLSGDGVGHAGLDILSGVRAAFGQDAALVANLECPITSRTLGKPYKWANLRCPPDRTQWLDGFSLLTLGNNHVCDYGEEGARDTRAALAGKRILAAGYGESLQEALAPAVLDLHGQTLAVIALCCPTTNSEHLATHRTPGVAPLGMGLLKQAVTLARREADALVVCLHWGYEGSHDPAPDQLRLARQAIDCGADAVIGCHSHTVQGWEQYRGRWVFYGLGNFLFLAGMAEAHADNGTVRQVPLTLEQGNRESLALAFRIQPDTGSGRLALERIQPMRFGDDLTPRPIALSELSFDLDAVNRRLDRYARCNRGRLGDRREPVFQSWIRNGVPAFRYVDASIMDAPGRYYAAQLWKVARITLNLYRSARRGMGRYWLEAGIERKWRRDAAVLPLTEAHRELYGVVHRFYRQELGRFPNLASCRDFNDKIQWLKLFDQDENIVRCSDKVLVRDHVRERVGEQYLVPLLQVCGRFSEIDFEALPESFVIKTTHDSGTVILVRDKLRLDRWAAAVRIEAALQRVHGWFQGEWAYTYVQPRILVEEFIAPDEPVPPPDYKFYCVEGTVRFCHFICDRGDDPKEQTVDRQGRDLETSLYPAFKLTHSFRMLERWEEMIGVAERLAQGFKCVRVDMYCTGDRIYLGEMTFWPMAGAYKGEGQKAVGRFLDFDRETFKPCIIPALDRKYGRHEMSV